MLVQMDSAYAQLQSAEFDGHITGHFDVQGQQRNEDVSFASTFAAPNKFRHQSKDDISLGSTGSRVYAFLSGRDEYQNGDAPKDRVESSQWPRFVSRIMQQQNPSLLLAISKSAAGELHHMASKVMLQPATIMDGISYDTLFLDMPGEQQKVTVLVDPATHLLREVKFDLRLAIEKAGATQVKQAEVTVDYTKVIPDAPVAGDAFAWTPPVGAVLISDSATEASADDGLSDSLKGLIGKDAPDFSLKGLDDKTTKLSDLKGNVVIVDFWATWCGPCVAALPHLDKLYKEQSDKGLKVLAVDLQEEKDKVQAFVTKKGWGLPVVLDSDGAVAGQYKAEAIPETIVIGKDGKVKQIFVGGGNEEAIAALVEKEMK